MFVYICFVILSTALSSTLLNSDFVNDTFLSVAGSPYEFERSLNVTCSSTLTLEAGVIIFFCEGCSLHVDGMLIAIGSINSNIIFSRKPNSTSGHWNSILISGQSILSHITMEYGGGITVNHNNAFEITSSTFRYTSGVALYQYHKNGELIVRNCTFLNSDRNHFSIYSSHTTVSSGKAIVEDCIFRDGGKSIFLRLTGIGSMIQRNLFHKNRCYQLVLLGQLGDVNHFHFPHLTISENRIFECSCYEFFYTSKVHHVWIWGNHFDMNNVSNSIVFLYSGSSPVTKRHLTIVEDNIFSNTQFTYYGASILYVHETYDLVIRNNLFLNNKGHMYGTKIIDFRNVGVIDGNVMGIPVGISNNSFISNIITVPLQPSGNSDSIIKISSSTNNNYTTNIFANPSSNVDVRIVRTNGDGIEMTNNWWGMENETMIMERIFDYRDDETLAVVEYVPFMSTISVCILHCGIFGKCSIDPKIGNPVCSCVDNYTKVANCEDFNIFSCFGIVSDDLNVVCSGHGICVSLDECFCMNDYYDFECNTTTCFGLLSNSSDVCNGRGFCIDHDICQCEDDNIFGKMCSLTYCNGVMSNETENVCSGHGKCIDYEICECTSQYYGSDCDVTICNNMFSNDTENVCSGRGDCVFGYCLCYSSSSLHYYGSDCELTICDGIYSNDTKLVCSGHGSCIDFEKCYCEKGYYGQFCDVCDPFVIIDCSPLHGNKSDDNSSNNNNDDDNNSNAKEIEKVFVFVMIGVASVSVVCLCVMLCICFCWICCFVCGILHLYCGGIQGSIFLKRKIVKNKLDKKNEEEERDGKYTEMKEEEIVYDDDTLSGEDEEMEKEVTDDGFDNADNNEIVDE